MDTVTSTVFRKTYASLNKPTTVTVNGHAMGLWLPAVPSDYWSVKGLDPKAGPEEVRLMPKMTQAQRDAILRRVNKG